MTAEELREQLRADLEHHGDADPMFFIGFISSWLASNVELHRLEQLVDQLDAAHPGGAR
ncbi:hypothetical protein ACQHIV_15875 [Kribbella sp. GL6]|uniref:hypothetical protein n=1 Tax=Kribbella sp. GL6 TaxID=3419765 RepID=UPI003D07DAE6